MRKYSQHNVWEQIFKTNNKPVIQDPNDLILLHATTEPQHENKEV